MRSLHCILLLQIAEIWRCISVCANHLLVTGLFDLSVTLTKPLFFLLQIKLSVFEVYVCLQLDLSKKDQDLREAQILAEKQAADLNAR